MTIASMSISGVPPFNGFISKWIIYQALLTTGNSLSVFAMVSALLGSVLTLASFVKVLNDSFMGVREKELKGDVLERSSFMNIPMLILALGCFVFGVFPGLVLERIVFPSIGEYVNLNISLIKLVGMYGWLVTALFIFILVFTKFFKKVRIVKNFVGGELLSSKNTSFDGTHFYGTIKDIPLMKLFYLAEERGALDIYQRALRLLPRAGIFFKDVGVRMIDNVYNRGNLILNQWVSNLKVIQNGLLAKYIIWIFAGIILLMEVIRR
jgi:NADH:ubiquinone oxidoreductase subunit 5 (subunit L)/multisubunit Na+/H+ antiporter MnhA subunit